MLQKAADSLKHILAQFFYQVNDGFFGEKKQLRSTKLKLLHIPPIYKKCDPGKKEYTKNLKLILKTELHSEDHVLEWFLSYFIE